MRSNSLIPEFRIDPVTGVLSTQPGQVVSPRGMANIAYFGGKPVGDASDDDMEITGVSQYAPLLQEAQSGRSC